MQHFYPYFILFIFICLSTLIQTQPKEPKSIACNFTLLSHNAQTKDIVYSALQNALSLRNTIGWYNAAWLTARAWTLAEWGEEISQNTQGMGNVIKKLITKIESDLKLLIPKEAARQLVDISTVPIPNLQVLEHLQKLKKENVLIGFGNQDPVEYEIYREKIKEKSNIDLRKLFSKIITISSYNDSHEELKKFGYYQYQPNWYIVSEPYPSQAFKETISTGNIVEIYDDLQKLIR